MAEKAGVVLTTIDPTDVPVAGTQLTEIFLGQTLGFGELPDAFPELPDQPVPPHARMLATTRILVYTLLL